MPRQRRQRGRDRFKRHLRTAIHANDRTHVRQLLTAHPDIYYYGALCESAPYLHDDERLPMWEQLYEERVAGMSLRPSAFTTSKVTGSASGGGVSPPSPGTSS